MKKHTGFQNNNNNKQPTMFFKIKDLYKYNKKILSANKVRVDFLSKKDELIIIDLFFLKGASVYRADFYNSHFGLINRTEAKTKENFYKRIHMIIKEYYGGFKNQKQITLEKTILKKKKNEQLNLLEKEKYHIIGDKNLITSKFLIDYSSFFIKELIRKSINKYKTEIYKVKKSYGENKITYILKSVTGEDIEIGTDTTFLIFSNKTYDKFYFMMKNRNMSYIRNIFENIPQPERRINKNTIEVTFKI